MMLRVTLKELQLVISRHQQYSQRSEHSGVGDQRPLHADLHWMDAPPGEEQPHSADRERSLAKPRIHQLLHHGPPRQRHDQLHGTLQQFLVSAHPLRLVAVERFLNSSSFQQIQGTSALGASIRVLPSLIAGALVNVSTGVFVSRMSVLWTVLISSVLSTIAPLLMALVRIDQTYWENAFFAQVSFTSMSISLASVALQQTSH